MGVTALETPAGRWRRHFGKTTGCAVYDDRPNDCRVFNCLQLLTALRAAHVVSEAHLFQEGGHGFGIRLIAGKPAAVWPELVLAFGSRNGWLSA